jgi:putative membrane protein
MKVPRGESPLGALFVKGGVEMNKLYNIAFIPIVTVLFPMAGNALAQWRGYGGHMGPGMMGWGYGMGWFWTIIMVVFWIAVIVGIIFLIKWLVISMGTGGRAVRSEDSPLEILKRRYARGEIEKQEFEEKKKDLA